MLARIAPALPRLADRWLLWVTRRKTPAALIVACVLCISLSMAAALRFAAPVALFDVPLQPAQTAEVERALTLWAQPFRGDEHSSQVFVARSRRGDLLLRLALAGLPHRYVPTTADELERAQSPLTPESVMDDRRRFGIEGDLVAGLRRMDGVEDASVVISAAPAEPVDADGRRAAPTASVQLLMQSGAHPSADTVDGVKRFIGAGYPGLSADRVTVVDGSGKLAAGSAGADQGAIRESRLESAVQTALDAVFGVGSTVVRVSVRSAGAVESTESTRVVPHGVLDADVGREHGNERGRAFDKERTNSHYAYDTLVQRRTSPSNAIRRISVAVFLDAARVRGATANDVGALVRAAAGADLRAGDLVVVEALPFARQPSAAAPSSQPRPPVAKALLPALTLCVIVALGVALWPRQPELPPAPDADDRSAAALCGALGKEMPQTAAYVLAGLPARLRERVLRSYDAQSRSQIEIYLRRA
ncbi:MAG: hypothetical protein M3T49_01085 [Candidatus Eremiobacteraeota bacterium]|nr:hypothetical protein [Candidatus Eremiobacteraeota bacterium]